MKENYLISKNISNIQTFENLINEYYVGYGNLTPDYSEFNNDTLDLIIDFEKKEIKINPLATNEYYDIVFSLFDRKYFENHGYFAKEDEVNFVSKKFYKKNKEKIQNLIYEKTTPKINY